MALNKKINFRCDENFEKLLYLKMKEANYHSYSEFIRNVVENSTIKQRCQGLEKLIYELNKIGVNLNQLSKHVNEEKLIDQLTLNTIGEIYSELTLLTKRFNNDS